MLNVIGRNKAKGQMVVEFALSLTIWAMVMSGTIFLCRLCLVRQHAHAASRFGTFLYATGRVTPETVRSQVEKYFAHLSDSSSVRWIYEAGRFTETPASRFYHLVQTRVTGLVSSARITEAVVAEEERKTP